MSQVIRVSVENIQKELNAILKHDKLMRQEQGSETDWHALSLQLIAENREYVEALREIVRILGPLHEGYAAYHIAYDLVETANAND